jgi:hypothetical protein
MRRLRRGGLIAARVSTGEGQGLQMGGGSPPGILLVHALVVVVQVGVEIEVGLTLSKSQSKKGESVGLSRVVRPLMLVGWDTS